MSSVPLKSSCSLSPGQPWGKIPREFGDWEQSEPLPRFPDGHPLGGPLHPQGVRGTVCVTRQG